VIPIALILLLLFFVFWFCLRSADLADHAVLARRTVIFVISAGFLLLDPGATSPFVVVSRRGSNVAARRQSLQWRDNSL
jgi:hypothetical protein